jgi:hypothetical protein
MAYGKGAQVLFCISEKIIPDDNELFRIKIFLRIASKYFPLIFLLTLPDFCAWQKQRIFQNRTKDSLCQGDKRKTTKDLQGIQRISRKH